MGKKDEVIESRQCVDCMVTFDLTAKEIEFYKSRGFELPKRCFKCRKARRENRKNARK